MAKIKKFDRTNSEEISEALERAAQTVAKKYGLDIKRWGFSYADAQTTFKLRAEIPGLEEARGAADFKKYANRPNKWENHGLPLPALGATVSVKKHQYTIVGYKQYERYPIMYVREDGAKGGFTVEYAKKLLGMAPTATAAAA